jgi:hypothetical protein
MRLLTGCFLCNSINSLSGPDQGITTQPVPHRKPSYFILRKPENLAKMKIHQLSLSLERKRYGELGVSPKSGIFTKSKIQIKTTTSRKLL